MLSVKFLKTFVNFIILLKSSFDDFGSRMITGYRITIRIGINEKFYAAQGIYGNKVYRRQRVAKGYSAIYDLIISNMFMLLSLLSDG